MESPSSIQMASAGDTASAETTRRGWPQYDTQAPHVRADRCPPTRSMTSAAHDHRHLIDLATDYPFGGFQPARADSAVRAHLPPSRSPLFASPPQNDAIFARALDFLAGAGFQLTDPALVPLLQDAAATIAAARCLSRALVAQSEATHADSPLPAHESAAHPSRQQNTSARTPSLQSKHRLPKGMVGDSPFDRLPVSSNHGAQQAHTQRDLRLESPASPSSAQSLQASRPVAPSGTWTPTDGGWHPRIVASVRYSGGPSFDDFEAFVFDMRRVFRTYPAHVPESSKVAVLAGQLEHHALTFFNSKNFYSSDWQTVCEHLQARFLPLAMPAATWRKFWNVFQYDETTHEERPIMEVIQQLERLQLRLGTSCNSEIMRCRLLGSFSDGMRAAMIQVNAYTYEDLRANALQTDQRRRQIQLSRDNRTATSALAHETLSSTSAARHILDDD
ncbi:unnamed protein product [Tilletia controversa]|nr:unnamed protein product [Tilletia controversa]CAD6976125.1 unnamed protein product [Tilletia controversa]